MIAFAYGPFTFEPGRALRVAGEAYRAWVMRYESEKLGERTAPAEAAQTDIIGLFGVDRGAFESRARREHAPARIDLIDFETGDAIGSFASDSDCGMTPGLIDDRSRYWIRSADRRRCRDVTLSQFAGIAAAHSAPENAWTAGLMPDSVMTTEAERWRPPTSWEIRHVVGEGSFTGVSGAKAAALVGVTPQNFRKYTARDGAASRQSMSFALWHLLLHRLGVQRA
ncbi:MAG TPA: hypothetical protein VMR06_16285 [Dokdonella sp.]|uniref:hypothetical protein n=1 Tax=Dokdonella sp. TaxID=2291710 RepID=UPI002CA76834|nr:hypothetical protein [Dokdonella sp.]HUD43548.1 hypothetical protein [Dokdonella sp.]